MIELVGRQGSIGRYGVPAGPIGEAIRRGEVIFGLARGARSRVRECHGERCEPYAIPRVGPWRSTLRSGHGPLVRR